jgi:aminopeptidase YwaD
MKKLMAVLLLAVPSFAARHVIDQKTFDAIALELSGERAQELDRRIVEYHRIQGSPMMESVAKDVVLPALKAANVEASIEQFPSDGATTYQTYVSPMGWTMRSGELWIEGAAPVRLCRYSDIPMCVSTYSKGGEWSGELIDAGAGTSDADYAGKDVRGKVVLASGYARDVVRKAVLKYGAAGTVIYPEPNDRPDHPDMIRYNGLWTRASELEKTSGSFQISANQYAKLKSLMEAGPVRVRGKIDADLAPFQLTVVHAWIRGSESPTDEVIVSAHLDHPKWSANDNASGSAALIELARTLRALIDAKKLAPPRRTIHFMWVPEYFGTVAYLTRHPEKRSCTAGGSGNGCIVANINMDMVGEDTVKTNGRFYMTRAPMSVPSFLDALLPDVLEQTREANLFAPSGSRNYWPASMTDYFQGSDHDMFLGVGVPSTMFGHDPDWTHHTSEDTPDKTDASEFRRVGVLAANAAYWIGSADAAQWQSLAPAMAAEMLRVDGERLVDLRRRGNARLAAVATKRVVDDAAAIDGAKLSPRGVFSGAPSPVRLPGRPRALTIPPLFSEVVAAWDPKANDLALFEAINFMDGTRTSAEIADLLSIELGQNFDAAWVDRTVAFLASQKLVEK